MTNRHMAIVAAAILAGASVFADNPATNVWLTGTNICDYLAIVKMMTNGVVAMTNDVSAQSLLDEANRTGKTPELVDLLVKSGEVCKARGHRWQLGCGMDGCLVVHPGEMRHCAVCGKTETKEPGVWK